MRSFLIILILLTAVAFGVYFNRDTVIDALNKNATIRNFLEKIIKPKEKPKPKPEPPKVVEKKTEPKPEPPKVVEKKPEPKPEPEPEPKYKPVEELFPLPEFQSIEQITANWTNIAKMSRSAFPQKITIKDEIATRIKIGDTYKDSHAPAGAKLIALKQNPKGLLIVTDRPKGIPVALVPVDKTNLPEILNQKYKKWKELKKQEVLKQRQQELVRRKKLEQREALMQDRNAEYQKYLDSLKPQGEEITSPLTDPRAQNLAIKLQSGEFPEFDYGDITEWFWLNNSENNQEIAPQQEPTKAENIILLTAIKDTIFGEIKNRIKTKIKDGNITSIENITTGEKY